MLGKCVCVCVYVCVCVCAFRRAGAVSGGAENTAGGSYAAVSGGFANTAEGTAAAAGGGYGNSATATVCCAVEAPCFSCGGYSRPHCEDGANRVPVHKHSNFLGVSFIALCSIYAVHVY